VEKKKNLLILRLQCQRNLKTIIQNQSRLIMKILLKLKIIKMKLLSAKILIKKKKRIKTKETLKILRKRYLLLIKKVQLVLSLLPKQTKLKLKEFST